MKGDLTIERLEQIFTCKAKDDHNEQESELGKDAELLEVDASIVLDPGSPNERLHRAMVDSGVVRY